MANIDPMSFTHFSFQLSIFELERTLTSCIGGFENLLTETDKKRVVYTVQIEGTIKDPFYLYIV